MEKVLLRLLRMSGDLNKNIKQKLIQHINKCAYEAMQGNKNSPNCKIDKDFKQGDTGDCCFWQVLQLYNVHPRDKKFLIV